MRIVQLILICCILNALIFALPAKRVVADVQGQSIVWWLVQIVIIANTITVGVDDVEFCRRRGFANIEKPVGVLQLPISRD